MPFFERSRMSLRSEFVVQAVKENANISMLCRRYGITRVTGYKWLRRFKDEGEAGIVERSRRPHNSPMRTSAATERLIIELRKEQPVWGGRKLKRRLEDLGMRGIPSASTITGILWRHGMIDPAEAAKRTLCKRFEYDGPNDLAQMDFKGHFAIGNGRCHPLTMLDDHSRFLLVLEACSNERTEIVKERLTTAFRRYGLPSAILTDNGSPWAHARSERNLTRLEVWLIRMGIKMKKSGIRHPQTMGKDERLHRSLKAEVIQGQWFRDLSECQEAFDAWRYIYNHERPHEALEMGVPADRYRVSHREYPETLPEIEYSGNDFVRKVQYNGIIHFKGNKYWVGRSLLGLPVAVRPTLDDGVYDVYFCRQKISQVKHLGSPMGEPRC